MLDVGSGRYNALARECSTPHVVKRHTSYTLFALPTTIPCPSGYHQSLTCSALCLISSRLFNASSTVQGVLDSLNLNASSTSISTSSISPVAPRPHSVALNSSSSSVGETRTMGEPGRGRASLRDLTCLESTGKVTPEPCEAVDISPPIV
jgi:hypothetical protein